MFKTFFTSEIISALKRPMIYIFFGLVSLMIFGATASDNIIIGGSVGNVLRNSPYVITNFVGIMSIFGLLMATAFFNNAALKDYNNNFDEILFSTPLNKAGYFFGRFFGALFLATIPMLGIYLGVILGSLIAPLAGWEDASRFGSFYTETFVNNYVLFILPNMFFAGTVIFALANIFRSTVISFVGSLLLIISYLVAGNLISDLENETIGALSDTFGIRTYYIVSKYFTTIEKNTLSPSFSGLLLLNRTIWVGWGTVILLASYLSFSFQQKNKKLKKVKKELKEAQNSFSLPTIHTTFTYKTDWLQFKSFFKTNFLSISKSITFKILFLFSAIILVSSLMGGFEYLGIQSYPVSYKVLDAIKGSTIIYVIIILVFFSGELIWRDRQCKINEVIDASPHNSFISLSAKALSLVLISSLLHLFFIFIGITYQLINGYTRIELDVYLLDFLYGNLPLFFIWSGVMILIQVLLNNKYIGYFVSILVIFVWTFILRMLDINTNMLIIGAGSNFSYSDMNAFGPGLLSTFWFNLYWSLFSLIALFVAGMLWNRGILSSLTSRIKTATKQLPRLYKLALSLSVLVWLLTAGWVYYNTQILNPYQTSNEREKQMADFEKKYKKYESVNLPKITNIKYYIDIFPKKRDFYAKAIIQLTNQSNSKIDSLHFVIDKKWHTEIKIPNSRLVLNDKQMGYQIYQLNSPLDTNQTISIEINTKYITQGFTNGMGTTKIVKNGTFLNNFDILPSLGYSQRMELSDKNTRKKYDLKPKIRMPKLDENPKKRMANYLTEGRSDYIDVETIISTSIDQIAIAPGSLIKKWEENARNYYHYKVDTLSQNFYSFISARFEVAKRKWKKVDIEVYYDKKHFVNVEMMLDAVERALDYYTSHFGPYYHKQCRIIEFPRYAAFAQAFPGTMPYSESIGFIANLEDENDNNIVDAVIAHEMAHQWWAHQIVGARMQGSTLFSEGFAEYSSLMTLKKISKTPMKMREFVKYDHDKYLRGRSREIEKELPLYKVENQGYIHYGKGSIILYALQDYIGEDKVNTAMRNFLNEFKYKKPPYPTSLDFIRYLEPQVPDSLKYLITDWFKKITLYDNRVKSATYKLLNNGKYLVSMDIESHKLRADTIGNETQIPINDWIDIGVFTDKDEQRLLYQKRVKINQEKMNFTFEVDSLPIRAAIDPRHLLIDRIYKDNRIRVKELE